MLFILSIIENIRTSYGQNAEFFRVKVGSTYSYYYVSVGYIITIDQLRSFS